MAVACVLAVSFAVSERVKLTVTLPPAKFLLANVAEALCAAPVFGSAAAAARADASAAACARRLAKYPFPRSTTYAATPSITMSKSTVRTRAWPDSRGREDAR